MSALHVRVRAAGEEYALPVDDVLEVAHYGDVVPVPGAPGGVLGVCNLRGQVLPVLDLARVLELSGAMAPQRLVVAEDAGRRAGLAVEAVHGVAELGEAGEQTESRYLSGAALIDGTLVGLVRPGALLDAVQFAT